MIDDEITIDTEFLQDETGSKSSARLSWWISLVFTLSILLVDMFTRFDVPESGYPLLTTVLMLCGGWAAGPRIAHYLFPQLAAAVQSVADAAAKRRDPGLGIEETR